MENCPLWLQEFCSSKSSKFLTIIVNEPSARINIASENAEPEVVSPSKIYFCNICNQNFRLQSEKVQHMKLH